MARGCRRAFDGSAESPEVACLTGSHVGVLLALTRSCLAELMNGTTDELG
jgi:hypothetical protein